ncbi:ABC transporter ATP-binding protein [Entomospira culicis]|uniref:ATP-binding cassette domain-containing protein n=1 Tax=Entomospira culicis TaxID=2719989 RepID=A0A968KWA5_9SPIO|nr:ATP-binding cassette domain-containing protein [Entomospira culicis]NIZ19829.1 ATP-binding cassette domain-containing protein [Entomospira culicis]NIZ70043.1 ATP-binding cassette domain-containing protein [Entomospira culicis]WDI37149.1 ATP-binding cassette domain-containing protein [Entomospira culicis]WDI38778.1 ATP-binding cassette domain-containing protein [Entomospira culicis]
MAIEINGLSKAFGGHQVLRSLDFSLPSSKRTALLGASGCGKSVLFHLLAGLLSLDSGRMQVDGELVDKLPVSYMQQKDLLLPWYTLLENASLPLVLSGVRKQEAHAQVQSHLARFGLADFTDHYPNQLSGGMRQRVALLRTMIYRQPIVLMDEPFSAIDALSAQQLRLFLKELQEKEQFTLFFITHNVEEALDLADEIWVMHKESTPQLQRIDSTGLDYEARRKLLWQALGVGQGVLSMH